MFSRLKITPRLIISVVVPLILAAAFAAYNIYSSWDTRSEMARLIGLAADVNAIGDLVHEMQRERGTSAVFIANKDGQTGVELTAQRGRTDEQRAKVATIWAKLNAAALSNEFDRVVKAAETALRELDSRRTMISGHAVSSNDAVAYYGDAVAKMLRVASELSKLSTRGDVALALSAFSDFMQAKEYAGLERASGAVGISSGRFTPSLYARMQALASAQSTYLDVFKATANARARAHLDELASSPAVEGVNKMRQIIMTEGLSGNLAGLDAKSWFDTATARIDLLKKTEDRLADGLLSQTKLIYDEATRALIELAGGIVLALVLSLGLVLVIARGITRPLAALGGCMAELAGGRLEAEVPGTDRRDEIGEMARAVGVFKTNGLERRRLEAQQREIEERAAAERKADMHKLAGDFQSAVGGIIGHVSAASTELEAAASTLTNTADTTQQLSTVVASASEQASSNVQAVASAAEELTGSVSEISRQVQESSRIAREAVSQAQKTDVRITELSQAASRIGEVVKLITAIAEQTNLLALNATIEAARAGEAGRGFAVVAQEVKALAAQTAKATDEISAQIVGMQTATQESVTEIKEIGGTITRISEIAATIAAAVEEQGSATQEIARNVQEAAQGTSQVAANIMDVNRGAAETGSASSQVLASARSLASESQRLEAEVTRFLETVRAA